MIKFVLILTSVVSLNFAVSFNNLDLELSQKSIELIFSEKAVAIESGQPVYPSNTKIWISKNDNSLSEVKLLVNEDEAILTSNEKIDLSNVTDLESGTYTLIVKDVNESTYGFTIQ